jgi:hypothetical protein
MGGGTHSDRMGVPAALIVMARVLLLCCTPPRLQPQEARAFASRELRRLEDAGVVRGVSLASLRRTPWRWAREWDWMAEIHLDHDGDWAALTSARQWDELLGDLRLVGMRPTLLVADAPEPVSSER